MASRYWVGGTGKWNSDLTTNWSSTSGGAGGASVPTTSDDVYFDANSGGGVVTLSGDGTSDFYIYAQTLTISGFTGTFQEDSSNYPNFEAVGSISTDAYFPSYTEIYVNAGQTISIETTDANAGFGQVSINSSGGTINFSQAQGTNSYGEPASFMSDLNLSVTASGTVVNLNSNVQIRGTNPSFTFQGNLATTINLNYYTYTSGPFMVYSSSNTSPSGLTINGSNAGAGMIFLDSDVSGWGNGVDLRGCTLSYGTNTEFFLEFSPGYGTQSVELGTNTNIPIIKVTDEVSPYFSGATTSFLDSGVTCTLLYMNTTQGSSTLTVNFPSGLWTVQHLRMVGYSTAKPLVITSTLVGGVGFSFYFSSSYTCYGKNITLDANTSYSYSDPGINGSSLYIGASSKVNGTTPSGTYGWVAADPPDISNLTEPFLETPSANSQWVAATYTSYSLPTATTSSAIGAGYSYANNQGVISKDTYNLVDSSVILEFPATATYGDFIVVIGAFLTTGAGTNGAYWHGMGQNGIFAGAGAWKSTSSGYLDARSSYLTDTFGSSGTSTGGVASATTGSNYLKISASSTTKKISSSFSTDGVTWSSPTSSSFTMNDMSLNLLRACRVMVAEHPNITSSNATPFGSVNIVSGKNTGSFYFDGHVSITDASSGWSNASSAFDGNSGTYASTGGVSPP